MNNSLLKVAIRQGAIFVPKEFFVSTTEITETTSVLLSRCQELGFTFSEELLRALNGVTPSVKITILETLQEITGVQKNWTPLVKGWDVPTGESFIDHFFTFFANVFGAKGVTMPCGHIIPEGTFPLERYNGCPFCGTPFELEKLTLKSQGTSLRVMELWREADVELYFNALLQSKTALDATQLDSLILLLREFPAPDCEIPMKETRMAVIASIMEKGEGEQAQKFFSAPNDILRFLWYRKTGFLQIIEPKTIQKRKKRNSKHIFAPLDRSAKQGKLTKESLKLKYSRKECRMVAKWLNNLAMSAGSMCENMHPKRGMWTRFIRALRLAEYSKQTGFEKLRAVLDLFYNQTYSVWQGKVEEHRRANNPDGAFALLQERPGAFARSLFANMLWFGSTPTLEAFREVSGEVPMRLLITLAMYSEYYFNPATRRSVKPLGGTIKSIPANKFLQLFPEKSLQSMQTEMEQVALQSLEKRFQAQKTASRTMYIEPSLFHVPLAIGDRSENIQDMPSALMGQRFPVEGNEIRLFMQWGTGLKAQHLDMDLSCLIAYDNGTEQCSFSNVVATGCKHSGDIRSIPDEVGTAEYISVNLDTLQAGGAKFVMFTCNAYSIGSLASGMVVGWMQSKYPMKISEKSGVAYDPSCVQQQIRITQPLSKGLVFGVLDVEKREIIWLEMPVQGQTVWNVNTAGVQALLSKLGSKFSVGNLLKIKAKAQNLTLAESPEADEVYNRDWAKNTAEVTQLFV